MKTLIIEDEKPAARYLAGILKEIGSLEVVDILDSIKSTVHWFEKNPPPELVFMDIHIADGSAFEIFEHIQITCPVIFTTAYDEYALRAFRVNSIDYLLKPITREAVEKSLDKLKTLTIKAGSEPDIQLMLQSLRQKKSYKTHFLLSAKGNKIVPLPAGDIAFFYINSGKVEATTMDDRTFPLDFNLDELDLKLNPEDFFRANRQFIISKIAVKDIDLWFNHRLSVNMKVTIPEKILISRTRVAEFRKWFTGE